MQRLLLGTAGDAARPIQPDGHRAEVRRSDFPAVQINRGSDWRYFGPASPRLAFMADACQSVLTPDLGHAFHRAGTRFFHGWHYSCADDVGLLRAFFDRWLPAPQGGVAADPERFVADYQAVAAHPYRDQYHPRVMEDGVVHTQARRRTPPQATRMTPVEPLREIAVRLEAARVATPDRVGRSRPRWPSIGRQVEVTSGTVLRPAAPIAVFFDPDGRVAGWRDHGRRGAGAKPTADPTGLREAIVRELGLGAATRLGGVRPCSCHRSAGRSRSASFRRRFHGRARAIRVQLDPASRKVIQCRFEPEEER
ncbi:MAG: hypothetical protein R2909_17580 [Gemmatimonadales bacterium]